MHSEEYIENRLAPQQKWFSKKATKYKRLYYTLNIIALLASLTVAALLQLQRFPKVVLTSITLISALATGLNQMFRSDKTWFLYRTISEFLKSENMFYKHSAGPYHKVPEEKKENLFVTRSEKIVLEALQLWKQIYSEKEHKSD